MSDLSSLENDLRAIEAINQRDVQFALAGDASMMMSQWTDDFVLLPPLGPILRGRRVIEEAWSASGRFFPGKPYLNRGIARQTTPQMLVRFRQDVIALKPSVVVIQGGTNDIAGITGPGTRGTLSDNLTSMAELARINGIRVVLASILPICDCSKSQTSIRSQVRITDFNEWIRTYAAANNAVYLDYYSELAEGRNFKRALTSDGFLPNEAGYDAMASLAERAIGDAQKGLKTP